MKKKRPTISVILSVYNGEKYIKTAIESILNQTYSNFEFLIFNDGSTDKTLQIIQNFQDSRIKYFSSTLNNGYIEHFNRGIALAKGKYIARMDADDVSMPNRFEKQVTFLEKNPSIAIVGSNAKLLYYPQNTWYRKKTNIETNSKKLKAILLFNCPFLHPTIMMRSEVAKKYQYEKDFYVAEDYRLWTKVLTNQKGANLKIPLLYYRVHTQNITLSKKKTQLESIKKIYQINLKNHKIPFTQNQLSIYLKCSNSYTQKLTLKELKTCEDWLIYFHEKLEETGKYEKQILNDIFRKQWFNICKKSKFVHFRFLKTYSRTAIYFKIPFYILLLNIFLLLISFFIKVIRNIRNKNQQLP